MTHDLKQAHAEADAARERLTQTVAELRHRTSPKVVVRETAETVSSKAKSFASAGDTALRARAGLPLAIGGALGVGMAFLTARSKRERRFHPKFKP